MFYFALSGPGVNNLSHQDTTMLFFGLALLLFTARGLGELARRFHQPAILGEIIAGIILGPTFFGTVLPHVQNLLFPTQGPLLLVLNSFMSIAITLFLLVAGIEVDLSAVFRQGRSSTIISLWGLAIPFALGYLSAWLWPSFWGSASPNTPFVFPLFLGIALGISALPVIAKIMMDLNLYRSDLGMIIISAAVINDLLGWIIFAVVLGMIGMHSVSVGHIILLTAGFVVVVAVFGRWILDRILPWLQAHLSWPGGIIGFALSSALFCAACTQAIGIHALFGAFLFGVAIGDSRHLRERTRNTIDQFVSFFFAPLFFASIGLKVNFATNFDIVLILALIGTATVGKLLGCGLGARFCGFSKRQSLAIGLGMNARGAMEIILGLLALEAGVINERLFVALVIMALVTSMTSGTLMQMIIRPKRQKRFFEYSSQKVFISVLFAPDNQGVIKEMAAVVAREYNLNAEGIFEAAWNREQLISTGLERGVAIPHARIANLAQPIVAVGISKGGVDFDSPDGELSKLIFFILTPLGEHEQQLEILSDIGKTFIEPQIVEKSLESKSYTEFLAVLKSSL